MGERANSDYSSVKEAGETEHGIQCCNKALTEHARKLRQFRWLRIETSRGSKRSICSVPSMPGRAQPPPSLLPLSPPRETCNLLSPLLWQGLLFLLHSFDSAPSVQTNQELLSMSSAAGNGEILCCVNRLQVFCGRTTFLI